MKLSRDLNLKLSQKLSLSQDLLLSLKLIQLPLMELKERIETELLENPALELKEKSKSSDQDLDNIEDSFSDDADYFADSSSASISSGLAPDSSKIDMHRQFLEGAITKEQSLADHLISQLECQNLSNKQINIGKIIISLIDEDGFFKDKIEEVFKEDEIEIAKEVLEIIQLFDPSGIASSGVQEALIFQIESMTEDKINQPAYEIIKNHFDLLISRKDAELERKLKTTKDKIKEAINFISQLNPYPGREYTSSDTNYITPDAFVYKRDNSLFVEMNEDILPTLTINKYLQKISRDVARKKRAGADHKFITEKINNANQFIKLINYRSKSLFRLVLSIVNTQEDFFYNGPKFLKPLTMKDIADKIGLSESTISRLASSKYIQTEWGIHDIKYFFSNAINKNISDIGRSSESIREIIKEIIEKEADGKISDQKIVDILQNKGINIARRTVAKYRKMLNILPSHKRNL